MGRRVSTSSCRRRRGRSAPRGYDLEAVAGGTRLTFSLDAELKGLKKLLMGSMVQKTMVGEVQALDNVKRIL